MRIALFLLGVLLMPLAMPTAVAWRADGWLVQEEIGGTRLAHGDEFGCHGMPGRDVRSDVLVVNECKDYLTSNIEASRWGSDPISFGLEGGVISSELNSALSEAGFRVVGDAAQTGSLRGLTVIERSGGSLEKNVASIEAIETAASERGYVSLYWEARIADLNMRKDGAVLDWIEEQPFWFTTWGEWFTASRQAHVTDQRNTSLTLWSPPTDGAEWSTPSNTRILLQGATFTEVVLDDGQPLHPLTEDDHHLKAGYRMITPEELVISLPPNVIAEVRWDNATNAVWNGPATFNDMTPFMAVGHHTHDLFEWSQPFDGRPLVFTWLIEPQADIEPTWVLPLIAVLTVLIAPTAIWWTVRQERIHQAALEEEE